MQLLIVSKSSTIDTESIIKAVVGSPDVSVTVTDIVSDTFDFSPYDVVYWRSATITSRFAKVAGRHTLLSKNKGNTIFINSFLLDKPQLVQKSVQQAHLANVQNTVNTIPTFLAANETSFAELIDEKKIVLPCIAKPNQGSQGNGVVLLTSTEDFLNIEKPKEYVFQNFIPNNEDYRVIVVGGAVIDVLKRRPSSESTKSYLNNLSQGGVAESVRDIDFYNKMATLGEQVAAAFSYQIAGIDFIVDSTSNKIYFMEINSVPQWEIFGAALKEDVGKIILGYMIQLGRRQQLPIASLIQSYYDGCLPFMSKAKQFHYLSRQYLLLKDESVYQQLLTLRPHWLSDSQQLRTKAAIIPNREFTSKKSGGRSYRRSAYETHYKIYEYNNIFFKALFLKKIFNESTEDICDAIDQNDLQAVTLKLLQDERSLFTLSTHAVNFLYHVKHFFPELVTIHPQQIIDIAHKFTTEFDWGLEAKIYLYTHAIIGESKFYSDAIQADFQTYQSMVSELENDIFANYSRVNLDQKCEVIVCSQLLGIPSRLQQPVSQEASQSLSNIGNFVVDTLNSSADYSISVRKSLGGSEHRNVLAIAALS